MGFCSVSLLLLLKGENAESLATFRIVLYICLLSFTNVSTSRPSRWIRATMCWRRRFRRRLMTCPHHFATVLRTAAAVSDCTGVASVLSTSTMPPPTWINQVRGHAVCRRYDMMYS